MTKVVVKFLKPDFLLGIAYCPGEVAGFDAWIGERLIAKGYAVLHGDGKPKLAGGRIPGARGYGPEDWDRGDMDQVEAHVAELKKTGKWPAHLDKPVEIGAPQILPSAQYGG